VLVSVSRADASDRELIEVDSDPTSRSARAKRGRPSGSGSNPTVLASANGSEQSESRDSGPARRSPGRERSERPGTFRSGSNPARASLSRSSRSLRLRSLPPCSLPSGEARSGDVRDSRPGRPGEAGSGIGRADLRRMRYAGVRAEDARPRGLRSGIVRTGPETVRGDPIG